MRHEDEAPLSPQIGRDPLTAVDVKVVGWLVDKRKAVIAEEERGEQSPRPLAVG